MASDYFCKKNYVVCNYRRGWVAFMDPMRSGYRTLENRIDGVVITFSNITEAKTLEAQLRETLAEKRKRVKKGTP